LTNTKDQGSEYLWQALRVVRVSTLDNPGSIKVIRSASAVKNKDWYT